MTLGLALCLVFLLDALVLRRRWRAVKTLAQAPAADHDAAAATTGTVVAFTPDGALLPPPVVAAAAAAMLRDDHEVLDLVPGVWRAGAAFDFLRLTDPARTHADRLAPGRTAGVGLVVRADLAARTRVVESGDATRALPAIAFLHLATELRRSARSMTHVVAPSLTRGDADPATRAALFRDVLGPVVPFGLAVPALLLALVAAAIAANPLAGFAALATFHLQPLVVLWRTPVRCPDLLYCTVLRTPLEIARWFALFARAAPWRALRLQTLHAARRDYEALLAGGMGSLFEPRAATCMLCGGTSLAPLVVSPDRLQHKPGRFTLDRCAGCGHVFQNPRLSAAGLAYYYRDFYDGLGEKIMDVVLGFGTAPYVARARMVAAHAAPADWLDVGAGHGHFCLCARDVLPATRFTALDLGEGAELALRRGWADRAIRGFFPEHAPALAGSFDVVSMSHYLEHTRDPRAEIAAAYGVLRPRGYLLIEVPDPAARTGRFLRSFWMSWFQPQHLHFLTVENARELLARAGFTVVVLQRKETHGGGDFAMAALLLLGRIGPPPDLPWRPQGGVFARARHVLTMLLGWPLLVAGGVADAIARPLLARPGGSNTYRMLAQRDDR